MIKLYKNIYDLRKKNGWTQEELAKKMGYTDRSMIAKIEFVSETRINTVFSGIFAII